MLRLKQIHAREWEFVHPEGYDGTMDDLEIGCDLYERGNLIEAQKVFVAIVEEIPDHLDGLHHWALVRQNLGDLAKAKELWEKAVSMGRKAFPRAFTIGKDTLPWGWIDNRPFLRCLHGFALAVFKIGDVKQANRILEEMLQLNPDDNQGARAIAIESFFRLGEPDGVLKICASYAGDGLPDTLYGRALANFQLGKKGEARKCLDVAMRLVPKVAKEIVREKHRRPKSMRPGFITLGGDDQAYDYWERNKDYWKNTAGAVDWVKTMLAKEKKTQAAFPNNNAGTIT